MIVLSSLYHHEKLTSARLPRVDSKLEWAAVRGACVCCESTGCGHLLAPSQRCVEAIE